MDKIKIVNNFWMMVIYYCYGYGINVVISVFLGDGFMRVRNILNKVI